MSLSDVHFSVGHKHWKDYILSGLYLYPNEACFVQLKLTPLEVICITFGINMETCFIYICLLVLYAMRTFRDHASRLRRWRGVTKMVEGYVCMRCLLYTSDAADE